MGNDEKQQRETVTFMLDTRKLLSEPNPVEAMITSVLEVYGNAGAGAGVDRHNMTTAMITGINYALAARGYASQQIDEGKKESGQELFRRFMDDLERVEMRIIGRRMHEPRGNNNSPE